jgi:hypothetical protein
MMLYCMAQVALVFSGPARLAKVFTGLFHLELTPGRREIALAHGRS